MKTSDLLHVAERIGHRIVDSALWDGPFCTWEVRQLDRVRGGAELKPADGTLYQGSAGIAWFLGELYRVTGDRRLAATAAGGLAHALRAGAELPALSFGFHSGRVGIAYAGVHLGGLLGRGDFRAAARDLLLPLQGLEHRDRGLDVIAGAAGAIPALLELHAELDDDRLFEIAVGLGDHLLARAERETGGWSWDTTGAGAIRRLVGFAHGTAGIALALLELHHATGRGAYRFAAEMAFLYEQRFYNPEQRNWPDLRHGQLSDLLYFNPPEKVRQAVTAAAVAAAEPGYMAAWCHGAPGIGLARVRAFELSGQTVYRRQAEAALAVTLASLRRRGNDTFSLCHGHGGNCDLPLYAAEVFGEPALRDLCLECADYGRGAFEEAGKPWRCGTPDMRPDPSLMLGEAGIGTFYLRLADPETPSLLVLRPPRRDGEPLVRSADTDEGFAKLARESSQQYFGTTAKILEALGRSPAALSLVDDAGAPLSRAPAEITYDGLCWLVDKEQGPAGELVGDAFLRERTAYELSAAADDFAAEYLARLIRAPVEEVAFDRVALVRHPGCEVVTNRWDWDRWLAGGMAGLPPRRDASAVITRDKSRTFVQPVSPFAAALLASLTTPASLTELMERVAELFASGQGLDRAVLHDTVCRQVRELYRAGLIEVAAASIEATAASTEVRAAAG